MIAWHEALREGDIDRVVALCSADVELRGPEGSGTGRALLRDWFEGSGLSLDIGAFLQRGEVVIVSQEARWSTGPGGSARVQTVASVFRVRAGLIVGIHRVDDLDAALEAGGIIPRTAPGSS